MIIRKLKERIKSLSGNMNEDKVKKDIKEIETINIELEHSVSKLIAENEHLKQTYKQLYDSIKPTPLKDELRKRKGNDLADNIVTKHTIAPEMLKIDVEPIAPRLLNNRTAHSDYLWHTQEQAAILREIVEQGKSQNPLNNSLDSTLKPSTSASRSQPSCNIKKDKIQQTPSSTQKNKVEAYSRIVKSSLKNKNYVVEPNGIANVQHSKLNVNSELLCVKKVQREKSRNQQERITTTAEVPLRKLTALESDTPKPVVTLVYSWKPRKSKTNVPISKPKIIKSISANKKEPSKSWGSIVFDVPSSSLDECKSSKFFSGIWTPAAPSIWPKIALSSPISSITFWIGNVTILRVYYVEGLGHNLFSVGQFCDSNLEVAFRQHTCFIRNLEGVDLLTGYQGNNMYTLSLGDMMASSPICLLSKASKTKSWLWPRRLSHLNFGIIDHLARHGLVQGLPKLKFEKDHMCSTCAMGKSKNQPHKPKLEDTNQEKLYLLHMDL
ncbi:retrovirus-related pol polyprotein from transposon TNT 1-94 [Tanacetum coccineum]